jgi:hypothetical protein
VPGVDRVHAAEHLDQRGFAGAVVAHQGQDFTFVQGERDVFECGDRPEVFGRVVHGENLGTGGDVGGLGMVGHFDAP